MRIWCMCVYIYIYIYMYVYMYAYYNVAQICQICCPRSLLSAVLHTG